MRTSNLSAFTLFERLRAALDALHLDVLGFVDGVSQANLVGAENAMEIKFPQFVRDMYLCSDGMQTSCVAPDLGKRKSPRLLPRYTEWICLADLVDYWEVSRKAEARTSGERDDHGGGAALRLRDGH